MNSEASAGRRSRIGIRVGGCGVGEGSVHESGQSSIVVVPNNKNHQIIERLCNNAIIATISIPIAAQKLPLV